MVLHAFLWESSYGLFWISRFFVRFVPIYFCKLSNRELLIFIRPNWLKFERSLRGSLKSICLIEWLGLIIIPVYCLCILKNNIWHFNFKIIVIFELKGLFYNWSVWVLFFFKFKFPNDEFENLLVWLT